SIIADAGLRRQTASLFDGKSGKNTCPCCRAQAMLLPAPMATQDFCQRIVCMDSGQEQWYRDGDLREAIQAFCAKHGFSLVDYALSVNAKSISKPKRSRKRS